MARIALLEREKNTLKGDETGLQSPSSAKGASAHEYSSNASIENGVEDEAEASTGLYRTGTDILTPISILDRRIDGETTMDKPMPNLVPNRPDLCPSQPTKRRPKYVCRCREGPHTVDLKSESQVLESMRPWIKTYFENLNVHCKCQPLKTRYLAPLKVPV